jgi:competence ComEA-like helix-hairpin-helix protein
LLCVILLAFSGLEQKDFPQVQAKEYVSQMKTIARMATKGVPGTAEQYDAIAAYMAKNFPKEEDATRINVNKATAEELVSVIGLTASEAKAVIAFREKHGEFRQWGDMLVIL